MKINVLGVSFDRVTRVEAKERVLSFLKENKPHTIYTANPEFVMAARKDKEFMEVLNSGDLVIPDGIGIVYASKLNRTKLPERVAAYDLIQEIFSEIKNTDTTVCFLGAAPGVAKVAKRKMEKKYPGIKIIGAYHGYFDSDKERIILNKLKKLKPDILLVGLGACKQEKWINERKDELYSKVLIGVGGSFDGMSGKVKRAPDIFCRLGLEWLYRLIKQPSRICRQIQIPIFMFTVIREKINEVFIR